MKKVVFITAFIKDALTDNTRKSLEDILLMCKQRFIFLDVAKAWLIILVIMGHMLIVLNPDYNKLLCRIVQELIYAFHMSAFFVIHGIVFNDKKWRVSSFKKFISKQTYTLIVPYMFFEVIGIIWKLVFQKQSIIAGVLNMVTVRCNVGADWFLPAMFLGDLIFFVYLKHQIHIYGIIATVISVVLPMYVSGNQVLIFLGRGMLAYGFIMIGYAGKKIFLSEKTKSSACLGLMLLVICMVAVSNIKTGGNDYYTCIINNPVTLLVGGVCGTLLIISFSRIISPPKAFVTVGRHTLTIMGTHQLVIYALTTLVPDIYGGSYIQGLVLVIAIILFELPVVYIIDSYLSFFVGRKAV